MKLTEINNLEDVDGGAGLYLSPAGGASKRLLSVLKKKRPDLKIKGVLDSFKAGVFCGLKVTKIDSISGGEGEKVVIAIERQSVRDNIASKLVESGFNDLYWVGSNFSCVDDVGFSSEKDTLYFFYDLSANPVNYEFIVCLSHAEAERKLRRLRRIHLVVVSGFSRSILDLSRKSMSSMADSQESDNYWFINNVIVPSVALLKSCEAYTVCGDRNDALMVYDNVATEIFPVGYDVSSPVEIDSIKNIASTSKYGVGGYGMPLRSSKSSKLFVKQWFVSRGIPPERTVVITIRDYSLQSVRNSNISVWVKFSKKLVDMGFYPVFVKDTYTDFIESEVDKFNVFHEASWNILLRMALYELVLLNVTVNTGPSVLCVLNDRVNYLIFMHMSDCGFVGSEEFHEGSGLCVGEQFPGSSEFQKVIWGGFDDCDVISSEFLEMMNVMGIRSERP